MIRIPFRNSDFRRLYQRLVWFGKSETIIGAGRNVSLCRSAYAGSVCAFVPVRMIAGTWRMSTRI
jgi:hypothetical protein